MDNVKVSRAIWKPSIDSLPDAVVDGALAVKEKDEIIIEYPENWRDTCIWKIIAIRENADMILLVPGTNYHGMTNWKIGPERGQKIKVKTSSFDPNAESFLKEKKWQSRYDDALAAGCSKDEAEAYANMEE